MCARNRWRPYHLGTTPRGRVLETVRADGQAVRALSATCEATHEDSNDAILPRKSDGAD